MGSKPVKECVIPSSIVNIRDGLAKVAIVNYAPVELKLNRRQFFCAIKVDEDAESTVVSYSEEIPEIGATLLPESHFSKLTSEIRMREKLSHSKRENSVELLQSSKRAISHTTDAIHYIDTGNARQIESALYRVSAFERQIIADKVDEIFEDGIIKESYSLWGLPVVLIRKADLKDNRFYVNFRRLHAVTKRENFSVATNRQCFRSIGWCPVPRCI